MATPGEKKALLFLSLVAVLGSIVRLVGAHQVPVPSADERRALEGQIRVVDSVRGGQGANGRRRGKRSRARRTNGDSARGPVTPPPPTSFPWPAPLPTLRRPPPTIDLDVASEQDLQALPGIGPALARRIVAERDSSGPFGSLDELQTRVRGVGPALVKRLAPAVTFSGPRRPPSAERTEPFGNGGTATRAKRRRGQVRSRSGA